MNRFERHPIRTILVILCLALIPIAAVGEWLLDRGAERELVVGTSRSYKPPRHLTLREWQPMTRYVFGPPEVRIANAQEPLLERYVLDIDRHGFIEPSVLYEAPDFEIAFVGGSTTECLYVATDDRFPYVAGRLLEERLDVKINSVNAGRAGSNVMHSLLATIGKVLPRRPDYVVLMHNTNDLGTLAQNGTYWTEAGHNKLVRARERSLETVVRDLRDMTVPNAYRHVRRGFKALAAAPAPLGAGRALAGQTTDQTKTGQPPTDQARDERFGVSPPTSSGPCEASSRRSGPGTSSQC